MIGPGQSFSRESIRKRIVDFGGVDNCNIVSLIVNNVYIADDYTLDKTYTAVGDDVTINGEVVNVYSLDSTVSFENLT